MQFIFQALTGVVELDDIEKALLSRLISRVLQVFNGRIGNWVTFKGRRIFFVKKKPFLIQLNIANVLDGVLKSSNTTVKKMASELVQTVPSTSKFKSFTESQTLSINRIRATTSTLVGETVNKIIPNNILAAVPKRPAEDVSMLYFMGTGTTFVREGIRKVFGGTVFPKINLKDVSISNVLWRDVVRGDRFLNSKVNLTTTASDAIEYFSVWAQARYDLTQRILKANNFKDIVLYRALTIPIKGLKVGDKTFMDIGTLSSFSDRRDTVGAFGNVVYRVTIPREMVFSTWNTGFGFSDLAEYLVLGDKIEVSAEIVDLFTRVARI